jgi:hypothetical protein
MVLYRYNSIPYTRMVALSREKITRRKMTQSFIFILLKGDEKGANVFINFIIISMNCKGLLAACFAQYFMTGSMTFIYKGTTPL